MKCPGSCYALKLSLLKSRHSYISQYCHFQQISIREDLILYKFFVIFIQWLSSFDSYKLTSWNLYCNWFFNMASLGSVHVSLSSSWSLWDVAWFWTSSHFGIRGEWQKGHFRTNKSLDPAYISQYVKLCDKSTWTWIFPMCKAKEHCWPG